MYSSSGFIFQEFLFSNLLNREFKAPSTRIRIFLSPQHFLSGFKLKFPRPHASDGIQIYSSTQDSSAIKCIQSMRHRMRHSGGRFVMTFFLIHYFSPLTKRNEKPVNALLPLQETEVFSLLFISSKPRD